MDILLLEIPLVVYLYELYEAEYQQLGSFCLV